MYVCICLVARINQRVFRNSSPQCFLCACVANDVGHKATGGPPQELAAKQLVIYIYIHVYIYIYSTRVFVMG